MTRIGIKPPTAAQRKALDLAHAEGYVTIGRRRSGDPNSTENHWWRECTQRGWPWIVLVQHRVTVTVIADTLPTGAYDGATAATVRSINQELTDVLGSSPGRFILGPERWHISFRPQYDEAIIVAEILSAHLGGWTAYRDGRRLKVSGRAAIGADTEVRLISGAAERRRLTSREAR